MKYPQNYPHQKKLEQIRIAQRIVFEKIVVMHKGQQRKIKGAICNVPVECDQTCNQLPHPPDRSCIIILIQLKRKLQSRGHVYFQASRPELIQQVLNWFKIHNPLYNLQIQQLILTTLITTSQLYKMMQTIMMHINKLYQTMSQQIVILLWSLVQEKMTN